MEATRLTSCSVNKTEVRDTADHKRSAITALDLYKNRFEKLQVHRLSCGCEVLDQFLQGGIISRGITEIAGESASGKTQLCMQLSLTAQLPLDMGGMGGGAVYICTEDVFPNKRLAQMVDLLKSRCNKTEVNSIPFTDNIFIEHAAEIEDLWFCISKKVPVLLDRGTVKLVIIDSIAALFRCEYSINEAIQRAKHLSSFASQLHKLSHSYNIPVICVNQVSDSFKTGDCNSGPRVIPALGLSWANFVTTRLMLTRTNKCVRMTQADDGEPRGDIDINVRTMEIIYAPHLPNSLCHYIIDQEGVKDIGYIR